MNLNYLARHEPVLAVRTWHALNWWRETFGLDTPDLSEPTLREGLRVLGIQALRSQLTECGVPKEVLDEAFGGGKSRRRAPRDPAAGVADLTKHLLLKRRWCFEAMANIDAADSRALLAVADLRQAEETDPSTLVSRDGASVGPDEEGMAELRRSICLVQEIAGQMAVDGAAEVRLSMADVDLLHHLGGLYGIRANRRHSPKLKLVGLFEQDRAYRTRTPRRFEMERSSELPMHWLHDKLLLGDVHFRQNFIVVYAVGFLTNLALGILPGHVFSCKMPRGEKAYLDHQLGERPEPAPLCGTAYVADRDDKGHCDRETCRKMHMLVGNPHVLGRRCAERAEELARRLYGRARGFEEMWEKANHSLITFRAMLR